jgi:hypothetical protein
VINNDRAYILAEEWLLVRHSGEIPEVALHSSLHYLCEDTEGPRFILADEELRPLQDAVLERYREIVLRDLDVGNRDRSLFRGIKRALHNWYRFARFSDTIGCPYEEFRETAAQALMLYLQQELDDVCSGKRSSSINCTTEAMLSFAHTLGIDSVDLPGKWACLCEKTTI